MTPRHGPRLSAPGLNVENPPPVRGSSPRWRNDCVIRLREDGKQEAYLRTLTRHAAMLEKVGAHDLSDPALLPHVTKYLKLPTSPDHRRHKDPKPSSGTMVQRLVLLRVLVNHARKYAKPPLPIDPLAGFKPPDQAKHSTWPRSAIRRCTCCPRCAPSWGSIGGMIHPGSASTSPCTPACGPRNCQQPNGAISIGSHGLCGFPAGRAASPGRWRSSESYNDILSEIGGPKARKPRLGGSSPARLPALHRPASASPPDPCRRDLDAGCLRSPGFPAACRGTPAGAPARRDAGGRR